MHRRWEFAQRDALHVARRPAHGALLGTYTTMRAPDRRTTPKRKGTPKAAGTARPYVTELEQVFPLRASCNCPDFLTSSLGVCKHLLVTLDDIFSSPRRAAAARGEVFRPLTVWRLAWDPALALRGPLDRLSGLRLERPGGRSVAPGRPSSAAGLGAHGRVFRANGPDPKVLASPARRLRLLRTLTQALAQVSRGQPALASTKANGWTVKASQAGWGTHEAMVASMDFAIAGRDFILGDAFSMADVIFGGTLRYMLRFGMLEPRATFSAYAERLAARPALHRAEARNAAIVQEHALGR